MLESGLLKLTSITRHTLREGDFQSNAHTVPEPIPQMPTVQALGGSAVMGPQPWSGWPEADEKADFLSPTLMSGDPLGWAISLSHYHYRLESHLVLFHSEEETPVTTAGH